MSVNRKSVVGVSVMIRSMFGWFALCKGGKSERSIGRVLSLLACTKSADFCVKLVGLFAIGANGAWSWLLVPFVSKRIQRTCHYWVVKGVFVFPL